MREKILKWSTRVVLSFWAFCITLVTIGLLTKSPNVFAVGLIIIYPLLFASVILLDKSTRPIFMRFWWRVMHKILPCVGEKCPCAVVLKNGNEMINAPDKKEEEK